MVVKKVSVVVGVAAVRVMLRVAVASSVLVVAYTVVVESMVVVAEITRVSVTYGYTSQLTSAGKAE